jgi:hypothetical protein
MLQTKPWGTCCVWLCLKQLGRRYSNVTRVPNGQTGLVYSDIVCLGVPVHLIHRIIFESLANRIVVVVMMTMMMMIRVTSNYKRYCPDLPFHLGDLTTFIRQGHKLSLGFTEVLKFAAWYWTEIFTVLCVTVLRNTCAFYRITMLTL